MSATNGICRWAESRPRPGCEPECLGRRVRDPREMDVFARLLDPRRGQEDLRTMFAGHAHRRPAAVQLGKIDRSRSSRPSPGPPPAASARDRERARSGAGAATSRRLVNGARAWRLADRLSGRSSSRGGGNSTAAASNRRTISCRSCPSTLKGTIGARDPRLQSAQLVDALPQADRTARETRPPLADGERASSSAAPIPAGTPCPSRPWRQHPGGRPRRPPPARSNGTRR